ncbi:MAG: DUF2799 domain-containing protein [Thiotrichaceae bacterium]|nr:DUF2799 domain-containing protein [Thiotrichaceae bacterium]
MMKFITWKHGGLLSLLLLSGCATLSKDECLRGEWSTVGYQDGAQGYPAKQFYEHVAACREHGVMPRQDVYLKGREQGLKQYCTAALGLKEGQAIRSYQLVCPANTQPVFLQGYMQGLNRALLDNAARVDVKRNELSYKQGQLSRTKEDKEVKRLQAEINSLNSELSRLTDEYYKIQEFIAQARSLGAY